MLNLSNLILLVFPTLYVSALVTIEQQALEDLFILNPQNSLGWDQNTDFCAFPDEVLCDALQEHVLEIDFNNINLQTIPASFWNLPQLTELTLNNMGSLVGQLPANINGLTSILDFRITRTSMDGVLPPEIGDLVTLEVLQLQSNLFDGPLPGSMVNLVNIELLKLRDNFFSGNMPGFFSNWQTCHSLILDDNDFDGVIPPEWADMPFLRILSVSGNALTGGFPDTFENHPSLFAVYAFDNQLSGWLWNGWDTLQSTSITGLIAIFHDNDLSGFVPNSFSRIGGAVPPNPANLQVLELAGNNWYCPLPNIASWAYSTDWNILENDPCVEPPTPSLTATPTAEPTPSQTNAPTPVQTIVPVSQQPCLPNFQDELGCDGVRFFDFHEPAPECPDAEEWCIRWFVTPAQAPGDAVTTCIPNNHNPSDTIYVGPADPFTDTIVAIVFGRNSFETGVESNIFDGIYQPDAGTLLCFYTPAPTPVPTPVPTPHPTQDACAAIPGWISNAMSTSFAPRIVPELSGFIEGTNELQIALNVSTKYIETQIEFAEGVCDDECLSYDDYTNTYGDAYWSISEDLDCWQTMVLTVPWDNLYNVQNNVDQGVGRLIRTDFPDEITFEGKLFVNLQEWLGYIDGRGITRAVESELNYIVIFPTNVEAQLATPLRVFYDVVSLSAVLDQIIVSTNGDATADVTLLTSVQWPFRLQVDPVPGVTIVSGNANTMSGTTELKQECVDPVGATFEDGVKNGNACQQHWRILIDPNGNCNIDGDYSMTFTAECQPSMAGDCPLDGDESIQVDFSLISEDFCAEVIEEVDIVADLRSFRDPSHLLPADDFFQDRTVYFAVEVVSAFADISQTTLTQITLEEAEGLVITTWDLMENNGAQASADGVAFSLVFDNNPVLQPGDPVQSHFDIVLHSSLLNVPYDWSSSLTVMVQMDVEFAGVGGNLLLEKQTKRFDVNLLALPAYRKMSIKDSFHIHGKGDAPENEVAPGGKSSAYSHCVHMYLFLIIFIVYAAVY